VDVLLSLASGWRGAPLENEDGGSLLVVLAFGFVGACLTVFERGLATTGVGSGLVTGGGIAGWGGEFGASTGSGSRSFGGSDSAIVGSRDGGMTSITLGDSGGGGGEGDLGTSGGVTSSVPLASGEDGLFFTSGNGEAWMIGWTGDHRCGEESPEVCALSRGGHSLFPTLVSFGGEETLEMRGGGHSLLSLTSSLAESPVV
jgi:hypothetical protein